MQSKSVNAGTIWYIFENIEKSLIFSILNILTIFVNFKIEKIFEYSKIFLFENQIDLEVGINT